MSKTKIEWCDETWNPVWGCKRGCKFGCYAERFHKRFAKKRGINNPFCKPTLIMDQLKRKFPKKPKKIFVGSMSDICYWEDIWMLDTIKIIKDYPQHIFMFLTKDPNIYERFNFPKNCWLGVTYYRFWEDRVKIMALSGLKKDKNVIFASVEPLLEDCMTEYLNLVDWIIIGGLRPKPKHKNSWVTKIIKETRITKMPIFLKDNLHYPKVRREFPE